MPRATARPVVRRLSKAAACAALGISDDSFMRHWAGVFTDVRTIGRWRQVFEDELQAATSESDPARMRAAVYEVRKLMGRVPAQAKTA